MGAELVRWQGMKARHAAIPALLAVALVRCETLPAWPQSKKCADARACTAMLCGGQGSEDELIEASTAVRHTRNLSAATRDRLVQCTRAALAAPDHVAPGSSCPEMPPPAAILRTGPHPEDPAVFDSYCPTRRELLLATAEAWGDDPAGRAVIDRAARDKRRGSARLARRALLALQDADAIAAAARDVEIGLPDDRTRAMLDLALAGRAAESEVPAIIAAADDLGGSVRRHVLPFVLGSIGGRLAVDRLARDLDSSDASPWSTLDALSRLGRAALPAAPALREMARRYYVPEVRERAAETYKKVTGTPTKPGPAPCPRVVKRLHNAWVAELSRTTLRFLPAAQSLGGGCVELSDAQHATFTYDAGDTCLLGYNFGEWGGGVVAVDKRTSRRRKIERGNPEGIARDGPGAILLFDGGFLGSKVIRLTRAPDGRFVKTWSVDIRSHVIAWTRDRAGNLLLLARHPDACGSHLPFAVLRVGEDRHVTALE